MDDLVCYPQAGQHCQKTLALLSVSLFSELKAGNGILKKSSSSNVDNNGSFTNEDLNFFF